MKLTVILIALCSLNLTSCKPGAEPRTTYAKVFVFWDGQFMGASGYESYTLGTNFSSLEENSGLYYKIKKTSTNKQGGVLAPDPVIINNTPRMMEQCGTYEITVSQNGDITKIDNFVYNGERNIPVARGIGWSMYITREDWRHE